MVSGRGKVDSWTDANCTTGTTGPTEVTLRRRRDSVRWSYGTPEEDTSTPWVSDFPRLQRPLTTPSRRNSCTCGPTQHRRGSEAVLKRDGVSPVILVSLQSSSSFVKVRTPPSQKGPRGFLCPYDHRPRHRHTDSDMDPHVRGRDGWVIPHPENGHEPRVVETPRESGSTRKARRRS